MKTKLATTLVVGLVLGLATAFIARQPEVQAQERVKAQAFEYKVVLVPDHRTSGGSNTGNADAMKMTTQFNALAADGWEYVGPVVETSARPYCFVLFKRQRASR
jgi:hypothetical protein